MNSYTLETLRTYLMAVRGETRVKTQEDTIRNLFIQEAVNEIFTEFPWHFTKRTAEIEIDEDGHYAVPRDFSAFNEFSAVGASGTYQRASFTLGADNAGRVYLTGPTESTLTLTYHVNAPDLSKPGAKVFFPQPMLIAERAYVRLKTAYFPDETSEREITKSRADVRRLYTDSRSPVSFTHAALR